MSELDEKFVEKVESAHFRTQNDTGANEYALFIWNIVRNHVGLTRIIKSDLPGYCLTHKKYHLINNDYGCKL